MAIGPPLHLSVWTNYGKAGLPLLRTSVCCLTVLERGLPPARTLTAVMPGNSPSSMRKAIGRALPSSRASMPPHSLGGQSYAQQKQWRASSRSMTSSAPSAKHLRPRNETTPPVPSLSFPSCDGSAQVVIQWRDQFGNYRNYQTSTAGPLPTELLKPRNDRRARSIESLMVAGTWWISSIRDSRRYSVISLEDSASSDLCFLLNGTLSLLL